ncbi:MAG: DeoR/GlpR family DNA-binding transcription regulator [Actinomycetota bacterium]
MRSKSTIQPKRIEKIVKIISDKKFVTVERLCDLIYVSPSTVRRDLRSLEEKGIIKRFHGGASIQKQVLVSFSKREKENIEEKRKIAKETVKVIKDYSTVILDAGTTVMQVARQLEKAPMESLTVISPTINIAQLLLGRKNIKILLPGGQLNAESNSLVGVLSIEAFEKKLMADVAILSCEAVSHDMEVMYSDLEIIQIKKAILNSATKKVLVVDSSKFGRVSLSSIGKINLFDMVITDNKLEDKYIEEIEKRKLKLIMAK